MTNYRKYAMNRPPAASTAAAWFTVAAPVKVAGAVVVGPTGVAVAAPPWVEEAPVVKVLLLIGIEAPPLGDETVEINVVTDAPEVQGTVMVVP